MAVQAAGSELAPIPEQGQLVVVRQRTYTVTQVAKSSIATVLTSAVQSRRQHLVTLASIEDDALGEELQVVWELEPGTSVQQSLSLPEPSGFGRVVEDRYAPELADRIWKAGLILTV